MLWIRQHIDIPHTTAAVVVRIIKAEFAFHPERFLELELVPQEYRKECLYSFYSPVAFSLGSRDGDVRYTAPDRIHYDGKDYRVIAVKNWQRFGFSKAIAVEKEGI